MDLSEYLDKLDNEIKCKQKTLNGLRELDHKYELKRKTNRWGTEYIYNEKINELATDVNIAYSCGCCDDAAICASPFIIVNGYKLYGSVQIVIGQRNAIYYDEDDYYGHSANKPIDDLENKLRDLDMSEKAVKIILDYFEEKRVI